MLLLLLLLLTVVWHMNLWVFVGATYFSSENQNLSPMAREVFVTDGECGSDSAGTGGASIPNCSHHPTGDLLIQGSFILDFFRLTPEVLFASRTDTEY